MPELTKEDCHDLIERAQELVKDYDAMLGEHKDAHEALAAAEAKLDATFDEMQALAAETDALETERTELEARDEELVGQLVELSDLMEATLAELEPLRDAERARDAAAERRDELEADIVKAVDDLDGGRGMNPDRYEELASHIGDLEQSWDAFDEEVAENQAVLDGGDLEGLEAEADRLQHDIDEVNEDIRETEDRLSEIREDLQTDNDRLGELENTFADEVQDLAEVYEEYRDEFEAEQENDGERGELMDEWLAHCGEFFGEDD